MKPRASFLYTRVRYAICHLTTPARNPRVSWPDMLFRFRQGRASACVDTLGVGGPSTEIEGGVPPAYTYDISDENHLDAEMDDDYSTNRREPKMNDGYDERRSPRRLPTRDSTDIPSLQSKFSDRRAASYGDASGRSDGTNVHAVSVDRLDGGSGRGGKGQKKKRAGGDRGGGGGVDDETRELER